MDKRPPVHYAKAGEVNIAYRVLGDGPLDLVWVPGLSSNLEMQWEEPIYFQWMQRFAAFSRLIAFDKRGMGLSDRNVGAPTLEERMDDVRAVMDAVGSKKAALLGDSEGGPMSILFAATYPERTVALVLVGTGACVRRDIDYPYGCEEAMAELYRIVDRAWGTGESLRIFGQSLLDYEPYREYHGRMERASGSPGTIRAMMDTFLDIDVRAVLPSISVPTLVVHTTDDACVPIDNGRYLAEHIAGAQFIEMPGEHEVFDIFQFADDVERFLTGRLPAHHSDRVLVTVLLTDIAGSTEFLAQVGDRRWKELLAAHDALVEAEVEQFRGRMVRSTGDGILATFDGPGRAIRCGCAIKEAVRSLGIDVRAGIHSGEIELQGDDVAGMAVHIGARVSALAGAGDVFVSSTVKDLVAGSGIDFEDRGEHELKGVPGSWKIYAVAD
jgi:class 3 adenylate cyclase/pimeloyl-ACP methyl ester carboxylesterase